MESVSGRESGQEDVSTSLKFNKNIIASSPSVGLLRPDRSIRSRNDVSAMIILAVAVFY